MTPRERYLAMLEGREPDFIPRIPILMQHAAELIGSNYGAFASDHRVLVEANLHCCETFGIDQLNTMSDPYRETQAYGATIIYEENMGPRCENIPLEEELDLSKLKRPDLLAAERIRDRIDALRLYRERAGEHYSIMGWVEGPAAEAADLRRLDNFFMDLIEEPEALGELMDLCVDVALDFARLQIEAGADTIGIGDAVASQVGPDDYEEHILPREQRLVAGLKEMDAKVRLHICGNITHLLPGIATLGVDVIDVDHMVSLRDARLSLGPSVAIGANLDPVQQVKNSTPEQIRADLQAAYAAAGEPFLAGAGCEIPPGTPDENLKALCEPLTSLGEGCVVSKS